VKEATMEKENATAVVEVPAPSTVPTPNLQMISTTLQGIQDQIKFADAKATFVATVNVLLFGFIVAHADRLSSVPNSGRHAEFWCALVFLILYALSAGLSVGFVVYAVIPRFKKLSPTGKTHFGHVLQNYGRDYDRYCKDLQAMNDTDWANEMALQIVEVSHIAHVKHHLIRRGTLWTITAVVLWLVALVSFSFVR
jgi:Family of unknown function (DUF5706)